MNSIGLKKVTYYLIRHKETREIMPQSKCRRGYSHWNPSNKNLIFHGASNTPRLFINEKSAKRTISAWFYMPNSRNTYNNEGECELDLKDDGRKKEDLEILKIRIIKA